MSRDPCSLVDEVIEIAVQAGEKILTVYNTDFRVYKKYDSSPVTEADHLADEIILAGLKTLTPEIPVLSEEAEHLPLSERKQWTRVWLVDPLDGTREFIKHNGEFTVNIALIDNNEPILGVVYAPVGGVVYFACRGNGAYKKQEKGLSVSIHSKKYDPAVPMVVTCSRSNLSGEILREFLTQIGPVKYVPMGSALKSCLVAEGSVDLYPRFGLTGEWDTAAAQCIVEEAGGNVTDTQLNPLRYNERESLINPHFLAFGDPDYNWQRLLKQFG